MEIKYAQKGMYMVPKKRITNISSRVWRPLEEKGRVENHKSDPIITPDVPAAQVKR